MTARCVLIVEDDIDSREALADALIDAGYTVEVAPEGRSALRRLLEAERMPDLVLLDLMMPELDGYGLLSEMNNDVRLAQIPTVLLSASPGARAPTPNVRAFLLKPVHLDKLLAAVTKYAAQA